MVTQKEKRKLDEMASKENEAALGEDKSTKHTRRRLSISSIGDVPNEDDGITRSIQKMKANENRFKVEYVKQDTIENDDQKKVVTIKEIPNIIEENLKQHIRNRSSVAGVRASHFQEDFEKKCVKLTGSADELNRNGIGYVCRKGLKPESPNQDDFIIITTEKFALYGIFDGHGPYGHDVSNYVQKQLPYKIIEDEEFFENPEKVFNNTFLDIHDTIAETTHKYLVSIRNRTNRRRVNPQSRVPQIQSEITDADGEQHKKEGKTEGKTEGKKEGTDTDNDTDSGSGSDSNTIFMSDDENESEQTIDENTDSNVPIKKKKKKSKAYFDCTMSGTTATILVHLYDKKKLYVAYVGDSRAVLGKRKKDGSNNLIAKDLTKDHKPNSPGERSRIIKAGGEVMKLEGDIPYRVFIKNKFYPGLAMSRAIGDIIGHQIGITSAPDFAEIDINEDEDVLVLLCSDGVWEFITSEEAINAIYQYGYEKVQDAVENLAREAWDRWLSEEENIVDDITVQAFYLTDKDRKTSP